jgi:hypothetical protein
LSVRQDGKERRLATVSSKRGARTGQGEGGKILVREEG